MSLWFVNALLVLVTLFALLKPLLDKSPSAKRRGTRGHGAVGNLLADRLAELKRERIAGLIGEDEYAQARHETELAYGACADDAGDPREAAQRTPAAAAVFVVAATLGAAVFYFYSSDGYRMMFAYRHAASVTAEFATVTAALERRLAEQPHDAEARLRLAEAKYLIGEYAAAAAEYRRADEVGALADTEAWLNYADALLRTGGAVRGERVLEALDKTLASEPGHRRALFFSGMLEFERGGHARATDYWRRLLALLPADAAESRHELSELIARAQTRAMRPAASTAGNTQQEAAQVGAITVTVSLSGALQAAPGDTVFVYARALTGPPMPLAIVRLTVADLPAEVRLDDGNAMIAGLSLAAFGPVEVVARVSPQGQATPVAGDLIGVVSPVGIGERVAVEISDVIK